MALSKNKIQQVLIAKVADEKVRKETTGTSEHVQTRHCERCCA